MDGLGSRRRIAHESCQMLIAFNSYEFVKLDSMPLCTKVTFSSSTSLFMESSVPCNPVFEGSTPLSQMFVLILTKVFLGLLPHESVAAYSRVLVILWWPISSCSPLTNSSVTLIQSKAQALSEQNAM